MFPLVISPLEITDDFEIVERKGVGHPDSICDALAETLSRNLCREYQNRFGEILHHNVDKALLCGGRSVPKFGGGRVTAPINIYLAGRAVSEAGDRRISIKDIAIEGSRAWLKANLHALEIDRHVRVDSFVQQGSQDLQSLFSRRAQGEAPLANDTSFGVGYAPLSSLEQFVLAVENRIHERDREHDMPAWGEDIKIMAVRYANTLQVTVACAMIDRFIADMDNYLEQKFALESLVQELAVGHGFSNCNIRINAADSLSSGSIYLTVTGTSAEAGDDGQVGRGNRVNGLITPCRPMSLEAAAGKNPVSHVGKIYNVLAKNIAETLVSSMAEVASAQCFMVSRIGAPVTQPAAVQIKLRTREGQSIDRLQKRVEEVVVDRLDQIPKLIGSLAAGAVPVF
jgi:S-adenosylmethionine synthetase